MKNLLTLLLLCVSGFLFAQDTTTAVQKQPLNLVSVQVTKVYDGDGCRALFPDGSIRKLRFANVDAPELKNTYVGIDSTQPHAYASRDSLRKIILGKWIYVDTLPYGVEPVYSYDRLLVDVFVQQTADSSLLYLNSYLTSRGWAWAVNSRYASRTHQELYDQIEQGQIEGKDGRQGLWGKKGRKYSPATWRKTHNSKNNHQPAATAKRTGTA